MAVEAPASAPVDGGLRGVSALCVRRPVLAMVLNLLVVVAGLAALFGVEVRELPNVDRPVVSISASYPGATPETVDKEVTAPLEGAAARIPGVRSIASSSGAGSSRVVVEFDAAADINVAANDLRDAVAGVEARLPDEVDEIAIVKADADADPVMRLAVTAPALSIEDLTRLVEDRIVDRLAAVDGVAAVPIYGGREPLVRILVDPQALAVRGLSLPDLEASLRTVALDAPAGTLSDPDRSLLVRADAGVAGPEAVEAIRIDRTTQVADVADVVFGPGERSSALRVNGTTGVGLGIVRQAQSNTLAISEGVRAAVAELNAGLPDGVTVRVNADDATFIGGAIAEVVRSLVVATLVVVAVIFLFLRSWRATLIPAVTVPIALLGTVAAIWLAGFSLNILTLLALVLATGMVVDDAIVVVENIERRRREGLGPRAAAVLGARQVFFAVVATTATLAAVFVPISLLPGTAGRLFSEFGFALAFAVLLSAAVALTLCPMLASRLLRHGAAGERPGALSRAIAGFGDRSARLYGRLLAAALAAPLVVLALAGIFAAGAALAYRTLPEELTPAEDRAMVRIFAAAPPGVTVDYMDAQMRQVEAAVRPLLDGGEASDAFVMAGDGFGFAVVRLAPWDERSRSQQAIAAQLNRALSEIPGIQVFARSANSLGIRGGGRGLRVAVTGTDYGEIAEAAEALKRAMEDEGRAFQSVWLSYDTTQPQLSLAVDRERAADLGISLEGLGAMLSTLLDGRDVGEYFVGDRAVSVRVEAPRGMFDDPGDLEQIYVRTGAGAMVPLAAFVAAAETAVAPELPREGQRRAVPLTASLAAGIDLRQAMAATERLAAAILPAGMGLTFLGEAATLDETRGGLGLTFGFALVVVLLVLAAQFESFVSALIVMATVPFGLAAGVYAILLTGGSLNLYSQIGLVMLVGIMAKNGILIVEFADQLRDAGESVRTAIATACRIRLRPVVMTMVSTVLGGLPLLLSSGAGAEARRALGWIVVGGLGFATLVTLFVTPVAFLLFAGLSRPRAAEAARLAAELGAAAGRQGLEGRRDAPA